MMHEAQTKNTCINVSTSSVVPKQPRDDGRDDEAHKKDKKDVVLVLPPHNWVLAEITNVCHPRLTTRFE
jgi:hypothetical protein